MNDIKLTGIPLLLLTLFLSPACVVPGAIPVKPNIILILADDMGWSDLGCYGSEIPTPNIDKLASRGLRFTQFYNTGRCCPTRASLLTGLYPHQTGVGHMNEDRGMPGYRGRLNDRCVTIAEVLQGAGYFTAMTGKWHVGQNHGVVPWERGFDRNLTAPAGGFYYPSPRAQLFLNGAAVSKRSPELPADWYSTDLWTEFGLKFIDEAVAAKKPFFLYLAHNAPHFPLQAPASEIARFRGKYKQGWDRLRRERYERQLQMGLIKQKWPLSPRSPAVTAWDTLTEDEKDRFDHIMAIYAAVVNHLDGSVGTLVEGLRKRDVLDNTLILILSDNGGNAESGPQGRLDGEEPGMVNSTVFCGESWANLENAPFRHYKHFNHEGGIATPLIVHWPALVKTGGELRTQPGHLIDIMATCVDVSGASYPGKSGEHNVLPMEGRSLLPAFANQPIRREALFWEHEGNAAVRVGDWKLVRAGRNAAWELYDLARDRTELNNMAAAERERVDSLSGQWEAWAERTQVKPYPPAAAAGQKKKAKQKSGDAPRQERK